MVGNPGGVDAPRCAATPWRCRWRRARSSRGRICNKHMHRHMTTSNILTPNCLFHPARWRAAPAAACWSQHGERKVWVGGDAPVVVQSMTNTDTADAIGTAIQVKELARAGSEIVRITVNTPEAAAAVPAIREQLDRMGVDVPLVGDFHYNGHTLLREYPGLRRRRCRSTASIRATWGRAPSATPSSPR